MKRLGGLAVVATAAAFGWARFCLKTHPPLNPHRDTPQRARPATTGAGRKYADLVHPLRTNVSIEYIANMANVEDPGLAAQAQGLPAPPAGVDPAEAERTGVLTPKAVMGPGNGDSIIWMFGDDLNGFDLNFTWGFYSGTGIWHRHGEGHTHPETEALIFVGLDPDNPDYLGAEIEFKLGMEFESQVFNKPSAVICPGGFVHLPCVTRWCDKPYGFLVGCLGASHAAPWVNPGDPV
jgi:hypothetical protein